MDHGPHRVSVREEEDREGVEKRSLSGPDHYREAGHCGRRRRRCHSCSRSFASFLFLWLATVGLGGVVSVEMFIDGIATINSQKGESSKDGGVETGEENSLSCLHLREFCQFPEQTFLDIFGESVDKFERKRRHANHFVALSCHEDEYISNQTSFCFGDESWGCLGEIKIWQSSSICLCFDLFFHMLSILIHEFDALEGHREEDNLFALLGKIFGTEYELIV